VLFTWWTKTYQFKCMCKKIYFSYCMVQLTLRFSPLICSSVFYYCFCKKSCSRITDLKIRIVQAVAVWLSGQRLHRSWVRIYLRQGVMHC
jgi:hypothetical protein